MIYSIYFRKIFTLIVSCYIPFLFCIEQNPIVYFVNNNRIKINSYTAHSPQAVVTQPSPEIEEPEEVIPAYLPTDWLFCKKTKLILSSAALIYCASMLWLYWIPKKIERSFWHEWKKEIPLDALKTIPNEEIFTELMNDLETHSPHEAVISASEAISLMEKDIHWCIRYNYFVDFLKMTKLSLLFSHSTKDKVLQKHLERVRFLKKIVEVEIKKRKITTEC